MTAAFRRDYLVRLPLPLAQLYARAHNGKSAKDRHDNAFYLFEAAVKLAASVATAAYRDDRRRGGPSSPKVDNALARLALPSLGHWLQMLRELARHFGERADAASHPLGRLSHQLTTSRRDLPAVLALYRRIKNGPDGSSAGDQSCSVLALLDALVLYRNAVFGHGGPRLDEFYAQDVGPLLLPAATELLAEPTFSPLGPAGGRLVYLSELRTLEDGSAEVGLRELIGLQAERAEPLRLSATEAAGLRPNRVAVLWPGRGVPLRLDPLLVYRETGAAEEFLFLNRGREKRVEYLSYAVGGTTLDPAASAALAELLAVITGTPVDEVRLGELAAASFADTAPEELSAPAPKAGLVLGDYELLGELGRGGMGVVHLARQLSLGRLVALKMLTANSEGDEVTAARFRREIRLLARCEHPNIVKVLASGTFRDGRAYYAMEYVPGCDLEQVLAETSGASPGLAPGSVTSWGRGVWVRAVSTATRKKREKVFRDSSCRPAADARADEAQPPEGVSSETHFANGTADARAADIAGIAPLPKQEPADLGADPGGYVRRVVELVRDAARALEAVHEQRVVHRDVKPANLMLTPDGSRVVLMDFGLAKGASLGITDGQGGFFGTLRYAAPEQLASAMVEVGPRADVRGLGVAFWELLARQRAFKNAADEKELASWVLTRDLPRLRDIDPSIDRDLEAVVARATEREAGARIASARLLADYLDLYLDGRPLPIRTPGLAELTRRWMKERKLLVATAAVAIAALAGNIVFAFALIDAARKKAVGEASENIKLARRMSALAERNKEIAGKELQARLRADERSAALERETRRANVLRLIAESREHGASRPASALDRAVQAAVLASQDGEPPPVVLQSLLDALPRVGGTPLRGHEEILYSASFSPDGRRVVTASADATARVWTLSADGSSAEEAVLRGHGGNVYSASFSPDGGKIITASRDGTARIWDLSAPDPSQAPVVLDGHGTLVFIAAFSPDGGRVVTGSDNGVVRVWDLSATDPTASPLVLRGHDATVSSASFSPDGQRLLTTAGNGPALVWDLAADDPAAAHRALDGHQAQVLLASFAPDGQRVVTGCDDGTVAVWDLATGDPPAAPIMLRGHSGLITAAAFSRDGRRVVTGSEDGVAAVWDLAVKDPSASAIALGGHQGAVTSATFSPDGQRVVSSSDDGTACVWDLTAPDPSATPLVLSGHDASVVSASFSPDGARIVTASWDKTARLWDPSVEGASKAPTLLRHGVSVTFANFSPDGRRIVTGSIDGKARVWNLSTLEPSAGPVVLGGHDAPLTCVAFSPNGARVLSGSYDGTVRVWDLSETDSSASALVLRPQSFLPLLIAPPPVIAASFSVDGSRVLTVLDQGQCLVWDLSATEPSAEALALSGAQAARLRSASFSRDGSRVAAGSWDGTTRVWEVSESEAADPLLFNGDGAVASVMFSPDGNRIATGADDWFARVWDLPASRTESAPLILKGHGSHVESASFSPDGQRLVTASWDETARIWDLSSPDPLSAPLVLGGHQGPVHSATFSPDGQRVVTASDDGVVRVWELSLQTLLDEAVNRLGLKPAGRPL